MPPPVWLGSRRWISGGNTDFVLYYRFHNSSGASFPNDIERHSLVIKLPEREANLSLPCTSEVVNPWSYSTTYLLTPWSTVILEKLPGFQLVQKFPAFYETRRFITALTSARHLSLPWASMIHSIPPHPTSWRSILILPSIYTCLYQGTSFSQVSPPKPAIRFSSPPYALRAPPISLFSILSPEQYFVSSTDN